MQGKRASLPRGNHLSRNPYRELSGLIDVRRLSVNNPSTERTHGQRAAGL